MDGQDVFTTPLQNIIATKALMEMIEPMLGPNNVATPTVVRVKAMMTAAAIQQHEQASAGPSRSRNRSAGQAVNSRPRASQHRGQES